MKNSLSLLSEIWALLSERKKWWLAPIIIMMLLLGMLLFEQSIGLGDAR
jgi:hypothetical protein